MPIMRTALYAVLVAGAVFSQSSAVAAEGSTLRGLKPPHDTSEAEAVDASSSSPGLKWRTADAFQDFAPRLTLYGGTIETQRFTINDADARVSLYRPFGRSLGLDTGSTNPLNDIVPKYSLSRQINQSLPGGWGLGFGVRQSIYNVGTSSLYSISAERYIGSFRSAYTLYSNRTEGSDLGSSHRIQVSYLYGERNTVGLAYTTGREIDNLVLPPSLTLNDARDLTLSGRHWLSTNWALTYDLQSHEQATLARRQGLRLGVSRSF
jgi:YaiO family outer membrane protein